MVPDKIFGSDAQLGQAARICYFGIGGSAQYGVYPGIVAPSQFLFYYIEPGPLSRSEAWWFNILVAAIWWCYYKACTVNPGPKGWVEKFAVTGKDKEDKEEESEEKKLQKGVRWCKKCKTVKPPRAHHCKKCGRCIPKMDHHCPWTSNCVSHITFPHFIRFVSYAVLTMSILAYNLTTRVYIIWENRSLPSYLGPSMWALAHLLILLIVNGLTLFALSLLLIHALHSLAINTTMIENWEIERHAAVVARARKSGGYIQLNSGLKIHIEHQEFPYDIGVWKNICQAMGSSNVLIWILPFGGGPSIQTAGIFEENGFEDEGTLWPPVDPEKVPAPRFNLAQHASIRDYDTVEEQVAAFKRRQEEDFQRRMLSKDHVGSGSDRDEDYENDYEEYEEGMDGEEGWTNAEGDRLRDYGVDEEAEALPDDDEVPLAELLRRRKARPFE
ncbi:hypothetical protein G7Y89_g2643 [Cudoniella acicularis]|uniref:Palmitoyltransferase PFA4 n=1 Tax=Cudoniella acicularis TaxID=354080 RepID=A0A8H4RSX9_9HELO|nr:hypothetical protein G7Y89_g2643 [Cudoniella acicularis]